MAYPLAPKTRWTYHLHQEVGQGVHFGDEMAALAKGNVLEADLISEVAGTDAIGGRQYARVETRLNGKPYLTE